MKEKHSLIVIVLFIILTISCCSSIAQGAIGIGVSFDNKLTFMEDSHGNTPPTFNLTAELSLQGYEKAYGHSEYNVTYEYASLSGGIFHRYGFEAGYSFTNLPIPFTDLKYAVTPFIGEGVIIRDGSTFSFTAGSKVTFKLTDWLKLNEKIGWYERGDLPNQKFGFFMNTGFEIELNTNYLNL